PIEKSVGVGVEKEMRTCLKREALVVHNSTRARQLIDGNDIYQHKK
ncbi:unnamed protein product, partial [marine sediment metagenome]